MDLQALKVALQPHLQGQYETAWNAYQNLAAQWHQEAVYWFWLGLLAFQLKHMKEAQQCLSQAGAKSYFPPDDFAMPPHFLLDILLYRHLCAQVPMEEGLRAVEGRSSSERLQFYELCIQAQLFSLTDIEKRIAQDWSEGQYWLGMRLILLGQKRGQNILEQLAQGTPPHLNAQIALGHLALEEKNFTGAIQHYKKVLQAHPEQVELRYHMGRIQHSLLNLESARTEIQRAILDSKIEHPLWQLQLACLYSPLPHKETQLELSLLEQELRSHHQKIPLVSCLKDLQRNGIEPLFDLLYLCDREKELRSLFGDVFVPPSDHFSPGVRASDDIHLGIVVTTGHEQIFWFGNKGLLELLMQQGFNISLFCAPGTPVYPPWQKRSDYQQISLSPDLRVAAEQMQKAQCDLMYFWECGTDPINFALPYFQTAPVQFSSWGSVATTGHPNMQYFLSTESLDPQGQKYYREKFLPLSHLPIIYQAIKAPQRAPDFLLPEQALYVGLPHNPLKFSNAFLDCLKDILKAKPELKVIAIESRHTQWQSHITQRITEKLGPYAEQIYWLPRLNAQAFILLLQALDLILDPFPFGSGKVCFEALSLGTPILTLAGDRLRGRIVTASYIQMEWLELICHTPSEYTHKAISLLQNPHTLKQYNKKLLSHTAKLSQNPESLEGFISALRQMRAGSKFKS